MITETKRPKKTITTILFIEQMIAHNTQIVENAKKMLDEYTNRLALLQSDEIAYFENENDYEAIKVLSKSALNAQRRQARKNKQAERVAKIKAFMSENMNLKSPSEGQIENIYGFVYEGNYLETEDLIDVISDQEPEPFAVSILKIDELFTFIQNL
jgi:hypothetical protein